MSLTDGKRFTTPSAMTHSLTDPSFPTVWTTFSFFKTSYKLIGSTGHGATFPIRPRYMVWTCACQQADFFRSFPDKLSTDLPDVFLCLCGLDGTWPLPCRAVA